MHLRQESVSSIVSHNQNLTIVDSVRKLNTFNMLPCVNSKLYDTNIHVSTYIITLQ